MGDERLPQDLPAGREALRLVQRYADFVEIVYPVAMDIPRQHAALRDTFLDDVLAQPKLFYQAGKSGQISKIQAADAGLATLRFHVRFMVHPKRHLISRPKARAASICLSEVGKMVGAWMKKTKKRQG